MLSSAASVSMTFWLMNCSFNINTIATQPCVFQCFVLFKLCKIQSSHRIYSLTLCWFGPDLLSSAFTYLSNRYTETMQARIWRMTLESQPLFYVCNCIIGNMLNSLYCTMKKAGVKEWIWICVKSQHKYEVGPVDKIDEDPFILFCLCRATQCFLKKTVMKN